ncbi:hypothetical protein ACLOJK_004779 [Asimina triloba]
MAAIQVSKTVHDDSAGQQSLELHMGSLIENSSKGRTWAADAFKQMQPQLNFKFQQSHGQLQEDVGKVESRFVGSKREKRGGRLVVEHLNKATWPRRFKECVRLAKTTHSSNFRLLQREAREAVQLGERFQ